MARGLCGRKCFRHLSGYEMATLAAYDPDMGYTLFKDRGTPSIHNCHGPAVNFSESGCEP